MGILWTATIADKVRELRELLPPGLIWTADAEARLSLFLEGCAAEFVRFHNRCNDLVDEADPATTDEQLADWERVLALPDCEWQPQFTPAERRDAVLARLSLYGGASIAYWTAFALALGATVTVAETLMPFTWSVTGADFDRMVCTDDCNASLLTLTTAGQYVRFEFEKFKPAHTAIFWTN